MFAKAEVSKPRLNTTRLPPVMVEIHAQLSRLNMSPQGVRACRLKGRVIRTSDSERSFKLSLGLRGRVVSAEWTFTYSVYAGNLVLHTGGVLHEYCTSAKGLVFIGATLSL
jgi:hypothetical protein